jgi:hypothetical protein
VIDPRRQRAIEPIGSSLRTRPALEVLVPDQAASGKLYRPVPRPTTPVSRSIASVLLGAATSDE